MTVGLSTIDLLSILQQDGWTGKKVASTNGGEYAGPCPMCDGRDRFRAWPNHPEGKGRWWCRGCEGSGDVLDLLQQRDGLTFREAKEALGLDPNGGGTRRPRSTPRPPAPPIPLTPPCELWQERAAAFVSWAYWTLWSEPGKEALAYLRGRGLSDETIKEAELGYNPYQMYRDRPAWGIEEPGPRFTLPPGVVIPWWIGGREDGDLWAVRVKLLPAHLARARQKGEEWPPYWLIKDGKAKAMYNVDDLEVGQPAVLVEGEIDALIVSQEAGNLTAAVATGSTGGGRAQRWLARLSLSSEVLVSYDADKRGEQAAQYWLGRLGKAKVKAKRWRPSWGDANDMHMAGMSVRRWVAAGLHSPEAAEALCGDAAEPAPVPQAGPEPDQPQPAATAPEPGPPGPVGAWEVRRRVVALDRAQGGREL